MSRVERDRGRRDGALPLSLRFSLPWMDYAVPGELRPLSRPATIRARLSAAGSCFEPRAGSGVPDSRFRNRISGAIHRTQGWSEGSDLAVDREGVDGNAQGGGDFRGKAQHGAEAGTALRWDGIRKRRGGGGRHAWRRRENGGELSALLRSQS